MQSWRFIDSGDCSAADNMALDEALSLSVRRGDSPPVLRVYGWDRQSVSIGHFQKAETVDLTYCEVNDIPVVRRPTGGRGILHGDELTYSFSARNEGLFSKGLLDTYLLIGTALKRAMEMTGIPITMKLERESGRNLVRSPLCFKSQSYGEIGTKGRKLVGSAQKRWRDGFLQQGSIPYSIDYEKLALVFREQAPADRAAQEDSPMIGLRETGSDFSPQRFKDSLRLAFEESFGVRLLEAPPTWKEEEAALLLRNENYQLLRR